MNINSVGSSMNNYNMSSFLNIMNNSNNPTEVPIIGSVDSYVQNYYSQEKLNGVSQNQELQNIFNSIEPTINTSTNIVPTSPTAYSDFQNSIDQNLINQLGEGSSPIDNNMLSAYTSIESGTYKPSYTSIMVTNPYTMYNNVNAMQNQIQSTGNLFNTMS